MKRTIRLFFAGLIAFGMVVATTGSANATVYGYIADIAGATDNSQVEIAVQIEKNPRFNDGVMSVRADAHILCKQNWDEHPCSWAHNWKVKLYRNNVLVNATVANCGNHPGEWGIGDCPDWGSFNFTTSYITWTTGTTWKAVLTHGDWSKADANPGRTHTFYCEGDFGNPNSSDQPCLQTTTYLLG